MSYNQIQQTNYVKRDVFRFANNHQLSQLFTDAGITNLTGSFDAANEPAIDNLVHNFIGSTVTAHRFTLPIPAFKAQVGDGNYGFSLASGTPSGQVNVAGLDYQSASGSPTGQERGRAVFNLTALPKNRAGLAPGGNTKSIAGAYRVRSTNFQFDS
ncbi:MAG: hypothetical protein PF501_05480 [Salinisphaera sp.]|nr:hypothetical protein [Salinisphaera sp.]